jgi:diacylglycerol kinase (ATP)
VLRLLFDGRRFLLRIWRATLNSWAGLKAAASSEAAFREEIIALVLAVPLAFLLTPLGWKRLALIGVILLLMVVELLNTAIEKLSDHVTAIHHPDIGRIKDMASAAVGITLAIAGFTWLLAIAEWLGLLAWVGLL